MPQTVVVEVSGYNDHVGSGFDLVGPNLSDHTDPRELVTAKAFVGRVNDHHVDVGPFVPPSEGVGVAEGGNDTDLGAG